MEKIRLGDVIIDPSLQVRKRTNQKKVTEYAIAMERGDEFPPIVIDSKSMKVISGFTRMEAYQRVFNADTKIPAVKQHFKNDNERYVFAVKENMKHGEPLQDWDKENAVFEMRRRGFSSENIALTVGWKIERVENVAGVRVKSFGSKPKAQPTKTVKVNNEEMPLKNGLSHLRGQEVPGAVYENIENHYVGQSVAFLARQIIYRIDDNTIDTANDREIEMLNKLLDKLQNFLQAAEVA